MDLSDTQKLQDALASIVNHFSQAFCAAQHGLNVRYSLRLCENSQSKFLTRRYVNYQVVLAPNVLQNLIYGAFFR